MSQTVSRKISSNRVVRSFRNQMSSLREIRFAQTNVCFAGKKCNVTLLLNQYTIITAFAIKKETFRKL